MITFISAARSGLEFSHSTSAMGKRHNATFNFMSTRRIPAFTPKTEPKYTSIVLPVVGLEITHKLDQSLIALGSKLADLFGFPWDEKNALEGWANRHLTFMGIAKDSFPPIDYDLLKSLCSSALWGKRFSLELAGLYFTVDQGRGVNIGVKAYLSDDSFRCLQEARVTMAQELLEVRSLNPKYLNGEVGKNGEGINDEKALYRTQISLWRFTPVDRGFEPFDPLAPKSKLGQILTEAASPEDNFIGTLDFNAEDLVLRRGLNTSMTRANDSTDVPIFLYDIDLQLEPSLDTAIQDQTGIKTLAQELIYERYANYGPLRIFFLTGYKTFNKRFLHEEEMRQLAVIAVSQNSELVGYSSAEEFFAGLDRFWLGGTGIPRFERYAPLLPASRQREIDSVRSYNLPFSEPPGLYISPDWRGKGYGQLLQSLKFELLKSWFGAETIFFAPYPGSERFHEKLGAIAHHNGDDQVIGHSTINISGLRTFLWEGTEAFRFDDQAKLTVYERKL
ncbi:MAG: hypothetical protein ABH823_00920 [bacterium]